LSLLDIQRLRDTPLRREPFDFLIVENFVPQRSCAELIDAFPALGRHGSFPLEPQECGPAMRRLAEELADEPLRQAIEDKFDIDLTDRPTMITLRGQGDARDGRIHTDSVTKLITMLIYLNAEWENQAGRLRLLRGPEDLDDFAAEVSPVAGTMVAFRRSERSYHGHYPHIGPRRSLQLNWVTDQRVVSRAIARHRWSARIKALNPFA
jgi:SM-20-related protein